MKFFSIVAASLLVAGNAFAAGENCEMNHAGKATHSTEKTEADCTAKGGKWMGGAHGKTDTHGKTQGKTDTAAPAPTTTTK